MPPLLYSTLVPWYRLIDPPADHADEVDSYRAAFLRAVPSAETLLELGAGAGHNAYHLKADFRCTLTDISEPMQALSRELNPECEHVLGDMRSLRLGRTFDVVMIHDAVMYLTTEDELAAAIETAWVHTRPGGAAVFAPDIVLDEFRESENVYTGEDGSRALRCLEWCWDPDPTDTTYLVDYGFLLREGLDVRAVHDRHVVGIFSRARWFALLENAGWRVETFERPFDDIHFDRVFLARKP